MALRAPSADCLLWFFHPYRSSRGARNPKYFRGSASRLGERRGRGPPSNTRSLSSLGEDSPGAISCPGRREASPKDRTAGRIWILARSGVTQQNRGELTL